MRAAVASAAQSGATLKGVRQFSRYGLIGIVNTAFGLGTTIGLQYVAGLGPYAANAGGYAVGLTTSFLLNRAWTFQVYSQPALRFIRFALAFGLAYLANLAALAILVDRVGPLLAQVGAMGVYSALFFILCRNLVFSDRLAS